MNTTRKRSLAYFAAAWFAACIMFVFLFIGRIDHFLAVGGAILAVLAVFILLNRAWALWEAGEAQELSVDG